MCGGDAQGKEEVIVHSGRRRGGGALKGVQVDEGMGAIGARRQNGKSKRESTLRSPDVGTMSDRA